MVMSISELGGEFALIERLIKKNTIEPGVLVGNGHDAAVVQFGEARVAITTDSVVEGRHFTLDYFSPEDVGVRALEGATSDILAVGGQPRFFCVALILPPTTSVDFLDGLYRGLSSSAGRLELAMIGGDTNSGVDKIAVNITVVGEIPKTRVPHSRTGAQIGDDIYISGGLGGSAAGMLALQKKIPGFDQLKAQHLRPRCRDDVAPTIAAMATAMIDVSDGLSSEIHHLCRASGCGAVLQQELLPAKNDVGVVAEKVSISALDFILNGGEEFELLYTVKQGTKGIGHRIGTITAGSEVFLLNGNEKRLLLAQGFNHFR